MTHIFNCMATAIGSMPNLDADAALEMALRYLPEAPAWPQLPQRDYRERMDVQYSESLPGLILDENMKKVSFNTAGDLTDDLEKFFTRYLEKDYEYFRISESYALGFHAFLKALNKGAAANATYLKGQITGPLTAGTSLKDDNGIDIIHNETLFDVLVKGLTMKALWQIEKLKPFGKPVIILMDEPSMESLGSAFSAVSSDLVAEKINEIADAIHEAGGLAGIHCCGNADWSMIFNARIDIVNFDAYEYMEKVMLYPADIKKFTESGGALAWGIVPTGSYKGSETPALLLSKLDAGIKYLEKQGIPREIILRQSLITPACGMGSLNPEKAEAILKLLQQVAEGMQLKIAAR
ncbi:MAG: methionine synthase [Syntrophales bacterium]|jgi:methionine synthase II (cobalamin-independent)|nr:methionine synthase [Syntrophales bacterium]